MRIPLALALGMLLISSLAAEPWMITLYVLRPDTHTVSLVIGTAAAATDNYDSTLDMAAPPPPPPPGNYWPVLYLEEERDYRRYLWRDLRDTLSDDLEFQLRFYNFSDEIGVISWDSTGLPEGYSFGFFVDYPSDSFPRTPLNPDSVKFFDMRSQSATTGQDNQVMLLRVRKASGMPENPPFSLRGIKVHPNPWSDRLTLELAEPASAAELVDPLGRTVRRWTNLPSGLSELLPTGSAKIADGVYYLRLSDGPTIRLVHRTGD